MNRVKRNISLEKLEEYLEKMETIESAMDAFDELVDTNITDVVVENEDGEKVIEPFSEFEAEMKKQTARGIRELKDRINELKALEKKI